MYEVLGAIITL